MADDENPRGSDTTTVQPRNTPAVVGLVVAIVAVVAPIIVRAALQAAQPNDYIAPFPAETLVLAVVAFVLSRRGKRRAETPGARGRTVAKWGIILSVVALLSAFGQFGAASQH